MKKNHHFIQRLRIARTDIAKLQRWIPVGHDGEVLRLPLASAGEATSVVMALTKEDAMTEARKRHGLLVAFVRQQKPRPGRGATL